MTTPLTDDYTRLQQLLDVIGNTPGAILVRGPERWIALQPGPEGWVLAIGPGAVPEWTDPATLPFNPG